jgi:GH15 family glucan-1,4-alpha-glucosidase
VVTSRSPAPAQPEDEGGTGQHQGSPDSAGSAGYLPVSEHGLIGDLHTVALVGTNGTIDWLCCPSFDAPAMFGSLLDAERGGSFELAAAVPAKTQQFYLPDTNVLITRLSAEDGVGEIQDFMPVADGDEAHRGRVIRRVLCVRGSMPFRAVVSPRFGYGMVPHTVADLAAGVVFTSPGQVTGLTATVPLQHDVLDVTAEFKLVEGESAAFALEDVTSGLEPRAISCAEAAKLQAATVTFWRNWLSASRYRGRWREMVHRSALTLKLLTYAPTGAIVAAPTTSLPEQIGGERNWDYRYVWVRDAAFCMYAMLRLGFTTEAKAFMQFMLKYAAPRPDGPSGPVQVMYGIDGRAELPERELGHLAGYQGSVPVRVGNGAATQLQLDIYGELMDSVYLYDDWYQPVSSAEWEAIIIRTDWVCENWDQPDEGIWETRGGPRKFLYSQLMCWVAIERAIRLAVRRGLPADVARWRGSRDEIYRRIMDRGWSEKLQAFAQFEGGDVLDASVLLMPLVKFISPVDPKWLSTLDALGTSLVSDSLVYRYDPVVSPDGLRGEEGTFSVCSFWYVEALTRAGRLDDARLAFEKMLTYANHVGLFAEQISRTGEQQGNFPQALTHLALISAAYNLDRALG